MSHILVQIFLSVKKILIHFAPSQHYLPNEADVTRGRKRKLKLKLENHTMLKAKFIVIAMLSLLMTAAALAQPARKNARTGNVVSNPRPKDWSFGASNPTSVSNQRTRRPQPKNFSLNFDKMSQAKTQPRANNSSTQPTESLSLNFANRPKQQATNTQPTESLSLNMVKRQNQTARRKR